MADSCFKFGTSGRNVRWLRRVLPLVSNVLVRLEKRQDRHTDKQTEERTPDRYITLSARRGQRDNVTVYHEHQLRI